MKTTESDGNEIIIFCLYATQKHQQQHTKKKSVCFKSYTRNERKRKKSKLQKSIRHIDTWRALSSHTDAIAMYHTYFMCLLDYSEHEKLCKWGARNGKEKN